MAQTTTIIGSFGKRLTLHVTQGSAYGPIPMTFLNPPDADHPEKWPINLTGSSFRGRIKRHPNDTDAIGDIEFVIVDAVNGQIEFDIPETMFVEECVGDTIQDPQSQFVFDMEWVQADGKPRPLAYGAIVVRRDV